MVSSSRRNVLVTGGAGYIGSCVVEELVERGDHPVVFDTFNWGRAPLEHLADRVTVYEGDVRSSKDLIYALQGVDSVIHLAGIVGAPACAQNPLAHHTVNVESVRTLVNCMTDADLDITRDLVYCSSCSVYGNVYGLYETVDEETPPMPLSKYAEGKLRAERVIFDKAAELPHFSPTVLRLTTIFGWSQRPRLDLVTNHFCYKALTERQITVHGQGLQYRSLIHVRDVARALVAAMEAPTYMRDRKVFHVGEETNNVTIRQIAELVQRNIPEAELLFRDAAESDRRDYRISCQRIRNTLGWQAQVSVEQGIREVVEKLRSGEIDMESAVHRNNHFEYV